MCLDRLTIAAERDRTQSHRQPAYGPPNALFAYSANVVAVGIDVTSVSDVRDSIERFGRHYLDRLFTRDEQVQCDDYADPVPHLAARYAAKEAAIKALAIDDAIPRWTSIEVLKQKAGYCRLRLTGRAVRIAEDLGVEELLVSLSHEADMAIAVVVATRDGGLRQ